MPIQRLFIDGRIQKLEDELIDEYRLNIVLDGVDFIQTVVLPDLLEEYVLGFLVTRKIIQDPNELSSLEISDGTARIQRIPALQGSLPKLDVLETTGSSNVALDQHPPLVEGPESPAFRVTAATIIQGVGMLAEMPIFQRTGGTHCAILFSAQGDPIISTEDIGRHNSVDKVIGGGLKRGIHFDRCWLAVSGRLPSDMIQKPVLAGIPLIASVSAPTRSGIEVGRRSGMTVIGFTRGGRLNCYSHPERIIGPVKRKLL